MVDTAGWGGWGVLVAVGSGVEVGFEVDCDTGWTWRRGSVEAVGGSEVTGSGIAKENSPDVWLVWGWR